MNKKIFHTVFERNLEFTADNIAVEHMDQTLTYGELNCLANKIAHALIGSGVKKGDPVWVLLPPSIAFVGALLGVFKSGGLFMAIHDTTPEGGLERLLAAASPGCLITGGDAPDSPFTQTKKIIADHDNTVRFLSLMNGEPVMEEERNPASSAMNADSKNPPLIPDEQSGCYIVGTSGTTGTPKLIEGSHRSLSHLIHWLKDEFQVTENDRVSLLAPVTNDVVFRDVLLPLLAGGTVMIPKDDVKYTTPKLLTWLDATGVTHIHSVPSMLRLFMRELAEPDADVKVPANLKRILLVGEPLYGEDVKRWFAIPGNAIELVNLYGASETLAKSFHRMKAPDTHMGHGALVGQPISNSALLIVKNNRLCNIGEIGEIHIKSPYITNGYYNDEERTRAVFIPNPLTGDPSDIVYKTGDFGRYTKNRSVEFAGRQDRQVKINGLRVELTEVEAAALSCPGMSEVFVSLHTTPDLESRLICYYTETKTVETTGLKGVLAEKLMPWMVPSYFVRLDHMPLMINGKVDKKALPTPEALICDDAAYEAPETATEIALSAIWQEVLGLPKVGVTHPFFEIGGTSLAAIRVVSRIYQTLNVELSIKDFFSNQTIRELALFLSTLSNTHYQPIPPSPIKEAYPLSPSQKRFVILDELEGRSHYHTIPGAWEVKGPLDLDAFMQTIGKIGETHESFRTTFHFNDGDPIQKIHDTGMGIVVEQKDASEEEVDALLERLARKTFDLSTGPLAHMTLIRITADYHIVFLTMHHVIGDAISMDIFAEEFTAIYPAMATGTLAGNLLPAIQYKDYAVWLKEPMQTRSLKRSQTYWMNRFQGDVPVLNLPYDYPHPPQKSYRGNVVTLALSPDMSAELKKSAASCQVTPFMLLTSLVTILLYRHTAQEDIVLGVITGGRHLPCLEKLVGCCVNVLPLRTGVRGEMSVLTVTKAVKKIMTDALLHQDYPFDQLVQDLQPKRMNGRSPLFDVSILMQDQGDITMTAGELTIRPRKLGTVVNQYDLDFVFMENEGRIILNLQYCEDLFRRSTVEMLADHLKKLVDAVISDRTVAISDIALSSLEASSAPVEISAQFHF